MSVNLTDGSSNLMVFHEVPDDFDTMLFCKMESQNNLVEIGVHRVFFGYRVRAGFVRSMGGCALDWCGGGNWDDVQRLYSIAVAVLSQRQENRDCFKGIPSISQIKPFYLDTVFTEQVIKLAGPDLKLLQIKERKLHYD